MIAPESLRVLADAVGEDGLEEHAPLSLEGAELSATLRPADGEALARTVSALCETGLAAVVRGSGSGLGLGNPPRGAALFLSAERLSGIDELDEVEGVCRAAAGTPLAALREKLAGTAWELPLDAPGTLGGCLAAARTGPRSLGFGPPRDVVLGIDVVLGTGERTRCGGRVVKNVTGYDLGKLYIGSLGSLGVIEAAWLRLRPRPDCARRLELAAADFTRACEDGLAAARRATARAVVARADAGVWRVEVELAGDERSVARDVDELGDAHGAQPADAAAAVDLDATGDALQFRVTSRASRLARAAGLLLDAGASLSVQPGLGLLDARFSAPSPRAWEAALAAAEAGGGAVRLDAAPLAVKRERDVFGGDPALLPLTRALKQRFDPHGVLNPGRFMGRG